jgi:hypothetical protein
MKKFAFFMLAVTMFLITGCKDESNPLHPEEHFEPEGWLFEDSLGVPLLVVWQAQVQPTWHNTVLNDRFSVGATEALTIRTRFLDSSGQVMDYPDEDYTLGWLLNNDTIASISHHQADKWSFVITGLTSGSTTVELRVLHGGHADVITPLLVIDVL